MMAKGMVKNVVTIHAKADERSIRDLVTKVIYANEIVLKRVWIVPLPSSSGWKFHLSGRL